MHNFVDHFSYPFINFGRDKAENKYVTHIFVVLYFNITYGTFNILLTNGKNRATNVLIVAMNDGLNTVELILKNSESGFVNDCPSTPNAIVAILSTIYLPAN